MAKRKISKHVTAEFKPDHYAHCGGTIKLTSNCNSNTFTITVKTFEKLLEYMQDELGCNNNDKDI